MTSVCILSAAWRRFEVTKLVLEQRQHLATELAARGVDAVNLIVADDENLEIARSHGAETLEAPNKPLAVKCNAGLRAAADLADHVVWVGSDDWIHPDVFATLPAERTETPMIITGRRLTIVDLAGGTMQPIAYQGQYGSIPWIIDSRLLRPNKPAIRPDHDRGLDGALIRGIRLFRIAFGFAWHDPHEFRCVDFKTRTNITPYAGLAKNLAIGPEQSDPWPKLAGFYPAALVEKASHLGSG